MRPMKKYLLVLVLLLFAPGLSHAITYYVATNGSDSNNCSATVPTARTITTPKLTIAAALTCMTAGDTLLIRGGTYSGLILNNVPTGTSWATPITIAGYPGETAILTRHASTESAIFTFGQNATVQRYIILDNLTLDGLSGHSLGDPAVGSHLIKIDGIFNRADHIRIQNSTLKRARMSAVLNTTNTTDPLSGCCNEYLNNEVADNGNWTNFPAGADFPPAFYASAANNLFEHNNIHGSASVGIDIWNSSIAGYTNNVIARYNRVWGNGIPGGKVGVGIMITKGSGTIVYNNLVYGNTGAGIATNYDVSNVTIYNNTIYNTSGDQYVNGACIHIGAGTSGTATVKNNICWANAGSNTVVNGGASATIVASNNSSSNPSFTNSGAGDFTLQAGSPAINAGVSTAPTVTDDFIGTARPQGAAYDIGAYEFGTPDTTPPTVTTRTPISGATGVSTGTTVTVTFSEAMNVATMTTSTILLTSPGPVSVPASVSCNVGCTTATLTPTSVLTTSTVYTATVVSGASGVKDVAGNALAANSVWSFTTAVLSGPPMYYVTKAGNDANNCTQAQTLATAKLTITSALACIGTGAGAGATATVEIGAGNYAEHLNESVNGGTTWANALIIKAASGASVWLTPSGGAGTRCVTLGTTSNKQYVIFDGINCDAAGAAEEGYKLGGFNATSGFMRISNAEIKNGGLTASPTGLIYGQGTEIHVDHCNIHHARTNIPGIWTVATNSIIEHNDIHDNGGAGIDQYVNPATAHGNTYRYNTIHGNGKYGVLMGSGNDTLFYNNLIYTNLGNGIWLGFGGTNNRLYNNTIWNNLNVANGRCISIEAPQTSAIARNNICWANTANTPVDTASSTLSNNLTTDPLFINSAIADFRLQNTSTAINTGFDLSATVIDDYIGLPRPQGPAFDIGAYEFPSPPAPTVICN